MGLSRQHRPESARGSSSHMNRRSARVVTGFFNSPRLRRRRTSAMRFRVRLIRFAAGLRVVRRRRLTLRN